MVVQKKDVTPTPQPPAISTLSPSYLKFKTEVDSFLKKKTKTSGVKVMTDMNQTSFMLMSQKVFQKVTPEYFKALELKEIAGLKFDFICSMFGWYLKDI